MAGVCARSTDGELQSCDPRKTIQATRRCEAMWKRSAGGTAKSAGA